MVPLCPQQSVADESSAQALNRPILPGDRLGGQVWRANRSHSLARGPFPEDLRSMLAREEQHLAFRLGFAEVNCQFNPGHTGHGNVGDKEMRSLLSACSDGVLRTIEGSCLEACVAQDRCQRLGDHDFIIYNEDYAFGIWHLCPLILSS